MIYRMLDPTEWDRLKTVLEVVPPPEVAAAAIAENDGEIVGVLFLQLAFHLEPLIIKDKWQGKVNFVRLAQTVDEKLQGGPTVEYFVSAPNAKIGRMAEIHGMTALHGILYHKVVGG